MSSYKVKLSDDSGEVINAAKRKVQSIILGRVISLNGCKQKTVDVLCMPGITGYEIEYFKFFSNVKSITAIDYDPVVCKALETKYKGDKRVTIIHAKTSEFFSITEMRFDLIYLDYFSNLSFVVRFDTETIIRRNLIRKGGRLITNIYGARESTADRYANNILAEELSLKLKRDFNRGDSERVRAMAYSSLIYSFRSKYGLKCNSPKWLKYKSNNSFMYTAALGITDYQPGKKVNPITGGGHDLWAVKNGIKEITAKGIRSAGATAWRRGLASPCTQHYKKLISDFYENKGYTPTVKEITNNLSLDWTGLVRSVGLCPRWKSSDQDILNEVSLIRERDGVVTWDSLRKARLEHKVVTRYWLRKEFGLCSYGYRKMVGSRKYSSNRYKQMLPTVGTA